MSAETSQQASQEHIAEDQFNRPSGQPFSFTEEVNGGLVNEAEIIRINDLKDTVEKLPDSLDKYMLIRQELVKDYDVMFQSPEAILKKFDLFHSTYNTTHSVYLKRLCEWEMLNIVHGVFDFTDFEIDKTQTPQNIREEYERYWSEEHYMQGDNPEGAVYQFSKKIELDLNEHPEFSEMAEFNRRMLSQYPWLNDPDYFTPSPYRDLIQGETRESNGLSIKDQIVYELQIETAHLFHIEISDLKSDSQYLLALFGASLDETTYERVEKAASDIVDKKERVLFADSFLALEFGDEFGDSLINIVEEAYPLQRKELLSSILELRHLAQSFGGTFAELDIDFAKSVEIASIKRITEVLVVAEALLKGETPQTTLYNGETVAAGDLTEVIEALQLLKEGFSYLEQALSSASEVVKKEVHGEQTVIHPAVPGSQIQLRKHGGDRNPSIEFDGEARINFLFSANRREIPLEVSSPQREQALSIRIDREGVIRDSDGNFVSTDPSIRQGSVSLDIGSIYGEKDNPNVKVGRILALGNALISAKRGEKPMFNHVREAFSEQYGDSEEFARVVEYLEQRMT